MKIYVSKVPAIAEEIVVTLAESGAIVVTESPEAQLDVEAVLKEYVRMDRELTDLAKDQLEKRGLSYSSFGKVKRELADRREFALGEEALSWIATQTIEAFMHSQFVEEVYADDGDLRRVMKDILKKHMMIDEELDAEVRRRIKNMTEGTATWDVEYARVMDQIKHTRKVQ